MMKQIIKLFWNEELECRVDDSGNVWVMDLEPAHKLREEIKDLKRQLQELQR